MNGIPSQELEVKLRQNTESTQQSVFATLKFILPDSQHAQGEAPAQMRVQGAFGFGPGDDVGRATPPSTDGIVSPAGTTVWMSGFRETADKGSTFGLTIDGIVFGKSEQTERFLVLPGGPSPIGPAPPRAWHFSEAGRRYYLDITATSSTHELAILPDAYPAGRSYRPIAIRDLPSLFTPDREVTTFGADQLGAYLEGSQYKLVGDPRAVDDAGFALQMPYANYHWELFVHAPIRIGDELTRQHRFEDALRWLHFLFDPTDTVGFKSSNDASRYWKALPLRKAGLPTRVSDLIASLFAPNAPTSTTAFREQLAEWLRAPFNPHAVARLRHGAYQWRVLFSYLDTVIAWADELFRQDSREAIAEATQLYVLAAHLLGPRPRLTPVRRAGPLESYRSLAASPEGARAWHAVADAQLMVRGSTALPHASSGALGPSSELSSTKDLKSIVLGSIARLPYFCVPPNEKLSGYWDTIADRLFKIRHSQNIEGLGRELALWDPPIDPEILVRAMAAGVDIESVLADRSAPLPPYRFSMLAQKAGELAAELRTLGASMLATLEKRDAEEVALLRAGHEVELLTLLGDSRQNQVDEAQKSVEALRSTRQLIAERWAQFQHLLGKTRVDVPAEGRPAPPMETPRLQAATNPYGELAGLSLIQREVSQLESLDTIEKLSFVTAGSESLGLIFFLAAAYYAASGDKDSAAMWSAFGEGAGKVAAAVKATSEYFGSLASKDGIIAGYERRRDEWVFQSNLAARELAQVDVQIAAAKFRHAVAQSDLTAHDRQLQQSKDVDDLLRHKFTNAQLYDWMVGRLSEVYFATYQLALDTAKRAERAYGYELGAETSTFVRSGHWDSLKHGLLVGEQLGRDLQRLQVAYLEQHRREYELTKHVSLLQLDPVALITLKEMGACEFELSEALFDLDFPGQYFRRI
jgi:hypothetical protein